MDELSAKLYVGNKGAKAADFNLSGSEREIGFSFGFQGESGRGGCLGNLVWSLSERDTVFN